MNLQQHRPETFKSRDNMSACVTHICTKKEHVTIVHPIKIVFNLHYSALLFITLHILFFYFYISCCQKKLCLSTFDPCFVFARFRFDQRFGSGTAWSMLQFFLCPYRERQGILRQAKFTSQFFCERIQNNINRRITKLARKQHEHRIICRAALRCKVMNLVVE